MMDPVAAGAIEADPIAAGAVEAGASPRAALAALYGRLASQGRSTLVDDRVEPDPLPVDGGSRWGVSAVLRPRDWPAGLSACADELRGLLGPGHLVYRPAAFHLTLRQFENRRERIDVDDDRLGRYADALRDVVRVVPPVRIRLCGLAASPTGVLVHGWPGDDLQALRLALHDRLAAADGLLAGPEADRDAVRTSAHGTLAIYGARVENATDLLAFLDRHETTDFGDFRFDEVWLVGYRRSRHDVALVEYRRFAFGGARS